MARCLRARLSEVQMAAPEPETPAEAPAPAAPSEPASARQTRPAHPRQAESRHRRWTPSPRTEAIRREAAAEGPRERAGVQTQGKGEGKPSGKAIFGQAIKKRPTPIGELELDMGMVVVEGDVFAVDNRELKKRGAWVVAFDLTDYTGSIRVNKFFPGDEGKPIVDGVKKGMHLQIQGRLNMDRFYGDMVLEPVCHHGGAASTMKDGRRAGEAGGAPPAHHHVRHGRPHRGGSQAGAGQKRGQAGGGLGPPGHRHHRPRGGPVLPGRLALRQEDQDPLRRGGVLHQRRGRPGGGPRGNGTAL